MEMCKACGPWLPLAGKGDCNCVLCVKASKMGKLRRERCLDSGVIAASRMTAQPCRPRQQLRQRSKIVLTVNGLSAMGLIENRVRTRGSIGLRVVAASVIVHRRGLDLLRTCA
eukprot:6465549-Amphidinium_carterae.1